MCVCAFICMYVCVSTRVCVYVGEKEIVYVCVRESMSVSVSVSARVYLCLLYVHYNSRRLEDLEYKDVIITIYKRKHSIDAWDKQHERACRVAGRRDSAHAREDLVHTPTNTAAHKDGKCDPQADLKRAKLFDTHIRVRTKWFYSDLE